MTEEAMIVGGGPAGAAVACLLAAAGRRPLLIEREAVARHKICGEFLSWEAQTMLAHLGIDLDALGATQVERLRLIYGRRVAETKLPFQARGLTRRALDAALLARAETLGAQLVRGVTVRSIVADGPELTIEADRPLRAKALFLASGKHDVRGQKRRSVDTVDDLIGFKTYFYLSEAQARALEGHIELILFDGGYAGLQCIEGGQANLCLLVTQHRFDREARRWQDLLAALIDEAPHLALRLDGAREALDRPLTIAGLPYGFIHHACAEDPAGLFRVGDQLGVIPSFAGDGLSIALTSGVTAAQVWLSGQDAAIYHDIMTSFLRRPIGIANSFYRISKNGVGRGMMLRAASIWPGLMRLGITATRMQRPLRVGLDG